MASVRNVGKVFNTPEEFQKYLESLRMTWRPRFVTVHHTADPSRATYDRWQGRVSDVQWMRNLASYYGRKWSAAPHFFITPTHICVLSPPERPGVHAASFNRYSWGVEIVGDFDREPFSGDIYEMAVGALAAMHAALGIQPEPFQRGVRGLHFHRDDPRTSKTCPGKGVDKKKLAAAIVARMTHETDSADPEGERQGLIGDIGDEPKPLHQSTIAQWATAGAGLSSINAVKEASDAVRDTTDNFSAVTAIIASPWVLLAVAVVVVCGIVIWRRYLKLRDQGV